MDKEQELFYIGGGPNRPMNTPAWEQNLRRPQNPYMQPAMRFPTNPANMLRANGAPNFPGQQYGASIEQIKNFIKKQKRLKGFAFTEAIGTNEHDISQLSGNASMFLGLALTSPVAGSLDGKIIRLEINNDIVIQQVAGTFLGAEFTDEEYYWIPRPLSGTDSILLTSVSDNADNLNVAVYYL